MDDAYPGTSTMDRLNSSQSGGSQLSAESNIQNQRYMQSKDLSSKLAIAKLQSKTQLETAAVSSAPGNVHAKLASEQQPHKLSLLHSQSTMQSSLAKYSKQLAVANVSSAQTRTMSQVALELYRHLRGSISPDDIALQTTNISKKLIQEHKNLTEGSFSNKLRYLMNRWSIGLK